MQFYYEKSVTNNVKGTHFSEILLNKHDSVKFAHV